MDRYTRFLYFAQFCLLIGSTLGLSSEIFAQQIPIFTQYVYEPSLYSPALAGADETAHINLGHRSQWIGIESSPSSQYLGFSGMRMKESALGIGGMLYHDQAHLLTQTQLSIFAAYHLLELASPHQFSIGVSGGFVNRRLNLSGNILIEDANDPLIVGRSYRKIQLDAGLGVFYQYKQDEYNWYLGVSSSQLPMAFELDKGIQYMLYNHVQATLGARFPLIEQLAIEPILLWRGIPGEFSIGGGGVDIGLRAHLMDDKLWLGGGIRPQQGGVHGALGLDFDKFSLTALYERHRYLGPSLEFGAGIPITSFSNTSSHSKPPQTRPKRTSKPASAQPSTRRPPKSELRSKKSKREVFWESTEALTEKLSTVSPQAEKFEVSSFPNRRIVLLNYQFSAEDDEYLIHKVPDVEAMVEHISAMIQDVLDPEQRPHLTEIVSIRLTSLLQDDQGILEAPAYVQYAGEWGDRIVKTYEIDGKIIAESIKQGKINRSQQAFLKLLSIQKELSASLNLSERKFEFLMETEASDSYLQEIRIEVTMK